MAHIPLLGRLTIREYLAVILAFLFVIAEGLLQPVILILPSSVIKWFRERSKRIYHRFSPPKPKSAEKTMAERIRKARDFEELCAIWGYTHEEHVVLTDDGYLLGLHRLPSKAGSARNTPGTSTGNPVVYFHHGLLMSSEVFICATEAQRNLPFVLVEQGYDVWFGNNRGNKYSQKHTKHSSASTKFWDYSMDDFAWHDIPNSIDYILGVTKAKSLSYIGFSQGTAQAFAALSIHPDLNNKVNIFIALAPAMAPAGLSAPVVDGLMKASPTLMFLFFGRRAILSSTTMWQSILDPRVFTQAIDTSLTFLFAWYSHNITTLQKHASYAHLYSYASVKSVVHWFQIMRHAEFRMYNDSVTLSTSKSMAYRPARFPTRNIVTPIVLLYGTQDSLVDIDVMLNELPEHTEAIPLEGYEHVDILWGKNMHKDVIVPVIAALNKHGIVPPKVTSYAEAAGGKELPATASPIVRLKAKSSEVESPEDTSSSEY